jgi:WD40 repeat protein
VGRATPASGRAPHTGCEDGHRPQSARLDRAGTTTTAWSTKTGKSLFAMRSHDTVWLVRFSPDGSRIVTAGNEGAARIWDVRTGKELHLLPSDANAVNDAQFSPDGQRLVTANDDGAARIWDVRTGKLLCETRQGSRGAALRAALLPSNQQVIVGFPSATEIYSCTAIGGVGSLLRAARNAAPREASVSAPARRGP